MVMPSPFERLLQQATETATKDPAAAYNELPELYGKSTTEAELQKLISFAANLGGAGLGRFADTINFLRQCQDSPHLQKDGPVWRSLHRAIGVMYLCLGQEAEAQEALQVGVTNASEQCRVAVMAAQTMTARGRNTDALPHLKRCANLVQELAADDDVVPVVAAIAANLGQHARNQLLRYQDLAQTAALAIVNSHAQHEDWALRHKTLFQQANTYLLCGRPSQALDVIGRMMALEGDNDAGPFQRYFSAAAACKAQMLRGQKKVAEQAHRACSMYREQCSDEEREQVDKAHEELEQFIINCKQSG